MPEIEIRDKNNAAVGKLQVPERVFAVEAKQGVVHDAVVNYLANQRQGTHATKTKGMVSGGGKKPWKQKHTGRARAGSSRSPLWRGGGTTFGPQPRDYSYDIPKKARQLALKSVLSGKFSDGEVVVLNELSFEKPRTKDMVAILKNLGMEGQSILIVIPERDENIYRSARNIPGVKVRRVADLNSYEVAVHSRILLTRQAVDLLAGEGQQ